MIFRNKLTRVLSILMLVVMTFLVGCDSSTQNIDNTTPSNSSNTNVDDNALEDTEQDEQSKQETTTAKPDVVKPEQPTNSTENRVEVNGKLEVHYIDVEQGDAILIKQDGASMLIDAGDNAYGRRIVQYLKDQGITKLDYIIGTHPHADHIGGMDDVIKSFDIGAVIMPKVTHTTKTFEDVVLAIKDKGLKITNPKVSETFNLGDAKFTINAPNSEKYDDFNEYSVITKLVYGQNSFLFTGDAEQISEGEVVASGQDISADVLKVGHHGSNTSTTDAFLSAVNPKYAVIQVGAENKYGHPTENTLKKLKSKNIEMYRNDLDGNIIAVSDGVNITFNTVKTVDVKQSKPKETPVKEYKEQKPSVIPIPPVAPEAPVAPEVVQPVQAVEVSAANYIGNVNSKILHNSSCSSLPNEENRIYFNSKDEGINTGYRGCKRCNP